MTSGGSHEDRGLEPVLSPATVHRPGFIPALVPPGRDQHVLQEGLKGLFQALAGSGWLPLVEFGSNGGQECRNPKGLPVAAFVGFAAPLITEVTCQSFFPGLSVRVIAEGLDSEERRLATWPEQKWQRPSQAERETYGGRSHHRGAFGQRDR